MAPPGALLVATVVLGRSLGSNVFVHLVAAAFTASVAVALCYFFSEDWRTLILGLMRRALGFINSPASRAKPPPPVNTNARK